MDEDLGDFSQMCKCVGRAQLCSLLAAGEEQQVKEMMCTDSFMLSSLRPCLSGGRCGQVHAIFHPGAAVKAQHPTSPHAWSQLWNQWGPTQCPCLGTDFWLFFFVPLQVMFKPFMLCMLQQCGMKCFTIKLRAWQAGHVDNLNNWIDNLITEKQWSW